MCEEDKKAEPPKDIAAELLNTLVATNWTPTTVRLYIDKRRKERYDNNALVVTEDRATQKCDLSAGYVVGGKGDAMDGAFFFSLYERYHSSRKHQCFQLMLTKLGGPAQSPTDTPSRMHMNSLQAITIG